MAELVVGCGWVCSWAERAGAGWRAGPVAAPAGRVVEAAVPGLVRRDLIRVALTVPGKRAGRDVDRGAGPGAARFFV